MALDEPLENDEIFKIDGMTYIVDHNLMQKFQPLHLEGTPEGIVVSAAIDYGAFCSKIEGF